MPATTEPVDNDPPNGWPEKGDDSIVHTHWGKLVVAESITYRPAPVLIVSRGTREGAHERKTYVPDQREWLRDEWCWVNRDRLGLLEDALRKIKERRALEHSI